MDISLIEFIVYGLVGYTGVLLLILSAFRETPTSKSQSIVRAMYLVLSIIAVIILAGSGVNVTTENEGSTNTLTYNVTTGSLIGNVTETGTTPSTYILNNPVWIPFHYMLAVVMLVYVLLQILTLFVKIN
jgi:hypothetical protein